MSPPANHFDRASHDTLAFHTSSRHQINHPQSGEESSKLKKGPLCRNPFVRRPDCPNGGSFLWVTLLVPFVYYMFRIMIPPAICVHQPYLSSPLKFISLPEWIGQTMSSSFCLPLIPKESGRGFWKLICCPKQGPLLTKIVQLKKKESQVKSRNSGVDFFPLEALPRCWVFGTSVSKGSVSAQRPSNRCSLPRTKSRPRKNQTCSPN